LLDSLLQEIRFYPHLGKKLVSEFLRDGARRSASDWI